MWGNKKIKGIKATFKDFLDELNKVVGKNDKALAALKFNRSLPIFRKFVLDIDQVKPSEGFLSF
jgi:hypothetical protein